MKVEFDFYYVNKKDFNKQTFIQHTELDFEELNNKYVDPFSFYKRAKEDSNSKVKIKVVKEDGAYKILQKDGREAGKDMLVNKYYYASSIDYDDKRSLLVCVYLKKENTKEEFTL